MINYLCCVIIQWESRLQIQCQSGQHPPPGTPKGFTLQNNTHTMSELNSILKNQNCFFATCQDIHILVYMYMIMYQHNMDATKLHDCTLYLHCYPKNDISFIMLGWYGRFLNICCHNSSLHADSAGTFVYFYRYLLLFWFFHANDTSVNTFLAIVYLFLLCSLSCW